MAQIQPKSPVHWSKDFVEHLRTIHFALIAVSTTLILIVLSAKPYNPSVAFRQIHQIIELKRLWSVEWNLRRGQKKQVVAESGGASTPAGASRGLSQIGEKTEWGNDTFFRELPEASQVEDSAPNVDSLGNIPITEQSLIVGNAELKDGRKIPLHFSIEKFWVQNHTEPDWSPKDFPNTLYDFRQWWDGLGKQQYEVLFPRTISSIDGECLTDESIASLRLDQSRKIATTDPDAVSISADLSENYFKFTGVGPAGDCIIPVKRFVYTAVNQGILAKQLQNWKVGPYDSAFHDLGTASRDFEGLELDDIEKLIAIEAAKGTEVFEAFGIKFPAEQVTLWGLVALLGVQVYFFLYLRQLSGKLCEGDSGWDVPWVGMDTSYLARIVLFISIVILPISATMLLAWHSPHGREGMSAQHYVAIAKQAWLIFAGLLTVFLSTLCWIFRPKSIVSASQSIVALQSNIGSDNDVLDVD